MPVYDRTYRRWDGQLKRHSLRFLPIVTAGIGLGLRRRKTMLRNLFFYGFLLASQVPFIGILLLNYLYYFPPVDLPFPEVNQAVAQLSPYQRLQYPMLLTFLQPMMMLYTVLFGAELISRDRDAMALPLYRSRPLTLGDYLLGKVGVIAFFLSCLTLIPCVLLWTFRVLASEEPGVLMDSLPTLGAILAHTSLLVGVLSLTILACSGLCRRPMVARILWFGGLVVMKSVPEAMSRALDQPAVLALSPFDAAQALSYRWYRLEEFSGELDLMRAFAEMNLGDQIPMTAAVASLLGYILLSLWIVARSVRKVETVGGGG